MSRRNLPKQHLLSFLRRSHADSWDETRGLGAYRTRAGDSGCSSSIAVEREAAQEDALGRLKELPLPEVRALALKYTMAARHGEDFVEAHRVKDAPRLSWATPMRPTVSRYRRRGASPATLRLNAKNWNLRLSKLAGRELASLTRTEVRSLHTTWGKAGHFTAAIKRSGC